MAADRLTLSLPRSQGRLRSIAPLPNSVLEFTEMLLPPLAKCFDGDTVCPGNALVAVCAPPGLGKAIHPPSAFQKAACTAFARDLLRMGLNTAAILDDDRTINEVSPATFDASRDQGAGDHVGQRPDRLNAAPAVERRSALMDEEPASLGVPRQQPVCFGGGDGTPCCEGRRAQSAMDDHGGPVAEPCFWRGVGKARSRHHCDSEPSPIYAAKATRSWRRPELEDRQ